MKPFMDACAQQNNKISVVSGSNQNATESNGFCTYSYGFISSAFESQGQDRLFGGGTVLSKQLIYNFVRSLGF